MNDTSRQQQPNAAEPADVSPHSSSSATGVQSAVNRWPDELLRTRYDLSNHD